MLGISSIENLDSKHKNIKSKCNQKKMKECENIFSATSSGIRNQDIQLIWSKVKSLVKIHVYI